MSFKIINMRKKSHRLRRNSTPVKKISTQGFIIKLLAFSLFIFIVFNLRISYNEKIEKLNIEANRLESKINLLDREIENLIIKKERLSRWKHISQKITEFDLNLINPEPGQVKIISFENEIKNNQKKVIEKRVQLSQN